MLNYTRIPLLYHPTNVAILDDEPEFLDFMRQTVSHEIPYVTETDPKKLLHYLSSHSYQPDTLSSLITKQHFDTENIDLNGTSEYFQVDYQQLQGELDKPNRFKKILVIFVDQVLKSKQSGLDFCRQVRETGLKIKLVLLTGQALVEEAIQALNDGLIDAYLNKGNVDTLEKNINHLIKQYMWEAFMEIGQSLSGFLSHLMKPLSDEQFIKVFDQVRQSQGTVEFYSLNTSCSFLLVNAVGAVKQFLACDEDAFKDIYDLAQDSKAPYDVLQAIRGRQQFPFTKTERGRLNLKGDAWENVMVSMDKVPGREWYYAVVERPDLKPFSFKRYFDEIWPQP